MAVLAKLKSTQLAPGSIEINEQAQSLDAARFKRDSRMLDLNMEFARRHDEIQKVYLDEVAEISGASE